MKTRYDERDATFGQMMVTLRTVMGFTQAGLAEYLGISRRAVGEWEAGSSFPKTERLKRFIELGVNRRVFPAGQEAEKIRALWRMAHQKVQLDEQWLSTLLVQVPSSPPPATQEKYEVAQARALPQSASRTRVDWRDALAISIFHGRKLEQALLTQWVAQEHCRVISLLGMGGIGKSALAVSEMHRLAEHFEVVIFRSLRDAPSCEALLDDLLQVLSPQSLGALPANPGQRISLLLQHLRASRAFIVLDNLETILEEGDAQGRLRSGFEDYGQLLRQVAETAHQGCLLLTSREKPAELRSLEGKRSPVRSLRLSGLDPAACAQLFAEKGVVGTWEEQAHLTEMYDGNPLALKIVTETIVELFEGKIGAFLELGEVIFGTIADLLSEQFTRLSALEQMVLLWLAIVREPATLDELLALLVTPLPRVRLLEAIDGLRRRSLVECGQRQGSFTLQSVVLEYVTVVLIAETASELQQGQLDHLCDYGLELAHAKEYVRQTQGRLLLAPLLASLQRVYPHPDDVEKLLHALLDQFRERADDAQGYGPANLIALLHELCGHLRKALFRGWLSEMPVCRPWRCRMPLWQEPPCATQSLARPLMPPGQ